MAAEQFHKRGLGAGSKACTHVCCLGKMNSSVGSLCIAEPHTVWLLPLT